MTVEGVITELERRDPATFAGKLVHLFAAGEEDCLGEGASIPPNTALFAILAEREVRELSEKRRTGRAGRQIFGLKYGPVFPARTVRHEVRVLPTCSSAYIGAIGSSSALWEASP
jgi:hypothetical protein